MRVHKRNAFIGLLLMLAVAGRASAQGTATDARLIAMGGAAGPNANIAGSLVPPSAPDAVIPIPLGLIQVFRGGFSTFNPTSDEFDPVRAIETTSNPLHYTFGASTSASPGQDFINDLINGRLSPNLATYSGFRIPETLSAEGLAAPHFGGTIKFAKQPNRFHGIFIGAGPYFSFNTRLDVDPRLSALLGDGTPAPNVAMSVRNLSEVQLAMSITVGYRGRLPLGPAAGANDERDGVYLAFNYHVLKGFRYLQPDVTARFDTNALGNLVPSPSTAPLSIVSVQGHSGKGRAADIGVQIVRGRLEGGFGLNGIGNRIDWSDFSQSTYTLSSLTSGFDFTEVPGVSPLTEVRVELPVVKTANVAYEGGGWGAMARIAQGYNGKSVYAGAERRVGPFWLRGGGKYTRGKWDPTYGFGIGNRVALDVAFYGTRANLEGKRLTAMALSIRIKSQN